MKSTNVLINIGKRKDYDMKKLVILAVTVAACTTWHANATLITFDDLTDNGSGTPIANGYAGLNWNNFYVLNTVDYGVPSGYLAGMVSANNVAFNAYGNEAIISDSVFTLNSAYLTAAWNDNLQVEVKGYNGVNLLYDNTYTLSSTAPTLINFNYVGVDDVTFDSSGGTQNPNYAGSGPHFAMDNMTINATAVPEASTMLAGALLLLPLGASTLRILRRKRMA